MSAANKKMLLVFEGGLAPGYTAVGAGMTEEGEARGFEVWAAHEGFRSLTGDTDSPLRLKRTVMKSEQAYELGKQAIPSQIMDRLIDDPGCDFRSERYPDFKQPEKQVVAARFIAEHRFSHVTFIGGNGSLKGAQAIAGKLDPAVKIGFINCSADSDILGDRSVGFLTALEEGSRVARGLYEDAYTHKRHYILEMMGNRGGKHALHCGCSARAHVIILPQMDLSDAIIKTIAETLAGKPYSLTVIAEGYQKNFRKANHPEKSAAECLRDELARFGLVNRPDRRVIAESFSRFIRGVPPLLMECELAYLKCQLLYDGFAKGESQIIAYYLGEHDLGTRPLDQVKTDNGVASVFLNMIDRFQITPLREHARQVYSV